jgi:hypothetical protein
MTSGMSFSINSDGIAVDRHDRSAQEVAGFAHTAAETQRLIQLCQKPGQERTPHDIR